ncbi:MAG: NAD(P)/FAD-dependent oxidoreductase [Defluviitaleaceae bacterium]|nr:NAD(P)/FAD-dependent oxidoreductase [Defluviitaleaceae bacterium]
MDNSNVIIIGSGPAGISAALYTARSNIKTTIISKKKGALATAKEIENYYGFSQPISGPDLQQRGIDQAKRLGVEIIAQEVVGITDDENGFTVETSEGEYNAKVVILATGASHTKPKWNNFSIYEGMGVSYCAVCDAFFFREKDVAVVGNGSYALHEVKALLPVVKSVTLCTDGQPPAEEFPPEVTVINKPVEALEGDTTLSAVRFKDGSTLNTNALFVAIGTAGSSNLANAIGAEVNNGNIVVDAFMNTTVPGLLAAGDCTMGMKQIAKAVYEGSLAGTEAIKIIREG